MTPVPNFHLKSRTYALCCCTVSLECLKNLFGLTSRGPYVRIDANGKWKKPIRMGKTTPISFYGHIRFSGVLEPVSGLPGLGLIPDAVVYCGTEMTFLHALEHFKSHPGLLIYNALYMEKHAHIVFEGDKFLVDGRRGDPGAVIVRSEPSEAPSFKVTILIPGTRFQPMETHFEICQT